MSSRSLSTEEKERAALAARVAANPFEYLELNEIGCLFHFGRDSMRGLLKFGETIKKPVPMVATRVNPADFKAWLASLGPVPKLTE